MDCAKQLTITITDAQLLRKASLLARRRKVKNETEFIKAAFIKAARVAVGLETDLSPNEVAGQLGCHINTVKNYMKARRFPHMYYTSAGRCRIPLVDVQALSGGTVAV